MSLAQARNDSIQGNKLAEKWKSVGMPKFKDHFGRVFVSTSIVTLIFMAMTLVFDDILKRIGYNTDTGELAMLIAFASSLFIIFVFSPFFAIVDFFVLQMVPN